MAKIIGAFDNLGEAQAAARLLAASCGGCGMRCVKQNHRQNHRRASAKAPSLPFVLSPSERALAGRRE